MIDDDFQLPALVAKYINRGDLDDKRKKNFLMRVNKIGRSNLELILIKYAQREKPTDLIKFPVKNSTCISASWRDSEARYSGGCYLN